MFSPEEIAEFLTHLLQLGLLLFLEWGAWLALSAWRSGFSGHEHDPESLDPSKGLVGRARSRGSRFDIRAA